MQTIFNQFKEQFKGKTLNEILHCAKLHYCNLSLIKDIDEYGNNEFAFVVEWYPNDEYGLITERIEVECSYSHLTGNAEFTLVNEEVTKFGRTWKIVKSLDLLEQEDGFPIWWKVIEMEYDGALWMNNCNGEMAFIEKNGRILKTII